MESLTELQKIITKFNRSLVKGDKKGVTLESLNSGKLKISSLKTYVSSLVKSHYVERRGDRLICVESIPLGFTSYKHKTKKPRYLNNLDPDSKWLLTLIKKEITNICYSKGIPAGQLDNTSNFVQELRFNLSDMIELSATLEDQLGLGFSLDLENCENIDDIILTIC